MISTIHLTTLPRDPTLQVRATLKDSTIDDYAAAYKHGGPGALDPISGLRDPEGKIWIWDGWTRLTAAERAGLTELPVSVEEGTREAAQLRALEQANTHHGERLTEGDNARKIELAYKIDGLRELPMLRLAERLHINRETCRRLIKKLTNEGRISPPEKTRDSKGREQPREKARATDGEPRPVPARPHLMAMLVTVPAEEMLSLSAEATGLPLDCRVQPARAWLALAEKGLLTASEQEGLIEQVQAAQRRIEREAEKRTPRGRVRELLLRYHAEGVEFFGGGEEGGERYVIDAVIARLPTASDEVIGRWEDALERLQRYEQAQREMIKRRLCALGPATLALSGGRDVEARPDLAFSTRYRDLGDLREALRRIEVLAGIVKEAPAEEEPAVDGEVGDACYAVSRAEPEAEEADDEPETEGPWVYTVDGVEPPTARYMRSVNSENTDGQEPCVPSWPAVVSSLAALPEGQTLTLDAEATALTASHRSRQAREWLRMAKQHFLTERENAGLLALIQLARRASDGAATEAAPAAAEQAEARAALRKAILDRMIDLEQSGVIGLVLGGAPRFWEELYSTINGSPPVEEWPEERRQALVAAIDHAYDLWIGERIASFGPPSLAVLPDAELATIINADMAEIVAWRARTGDQPAAVAPETEEVTAEAPEPAAAPSLVGVCVICAIPTDGDEDGACDVCGADVVDVAHYSADHLIWQAKELKQAPAATPPAAPVEAGAWSPPTVEEAAEKRPNGVWSLSLEATLQSISTTVTLCQARAKGNLAPADDLAARVRADLDRLCVAARAVGLEPVQLQPFGEWAIGEGIGTFPAPTLTVVQLDVERDDEAHPRAVLTVFRGSLRSSHAEGSIVLRLPSRPR